MRDTHKYGERTIALALLGAVLFSVPVLNSFDADGGAFLLGIPTLYLYLFAAWAVLIGLLVLVLEPSAGSKGEPTASTSGDDQNGSDPV